jgi:hypothetical protein
MQFELGSLGDIPDDKLKELLAAMVTRIKDAKKKVSQCLKNNKPLMTAWITKLGVDPPKAAPEELAGIRAQRKHEFEMALLSHPEAFVAFQTSSFLVAMQEELRQERNRRAPMKKPSK